MRVITGSARGMKLLSVEGMDTRPTSDWTKESMFNIIQFDIEGRRVLDLFSGIGQLGIEALSRGAKSCVFIDNRRDCVQVTQKNVDKTGFHDVSSVEQSDYRAYLKRTGKEAFGLIFLDPPYGNGMLQRAISTIYERDILSPGGLIVCEGEREDKLPLPPEKYEQQEKEYFYGKTKITIIRKKDTEA